MQGHESIIIIFRYSFNYLSIYSCYTLISHSIKYYARP